MKNEWIVKERIELLQYLFKQMNHKSRNSVKSILSRGQVVVNGQVSKQFDDPLQPGDVISIKDRVVPTDIKLRGINILFEDDDLIVIEKNAGLLTIATDTEKEHTAYKELTYYLRKTQPKRKLFVVHRLDRDTSGLLIFAKNKETKEKIQQTWHQSVPERRYLALVEGHVENGDTITSWLTDSKNHIVHSSPTNNGGKKAITHYQVAKTNKYFSLLDVQLETGRKNQIRVHMQDIGHSVVGDKKYGATSNPIRRLGLHAYLLKFVHPKTNQLLTFETEVPKSFIHIFR